MEADILLWIQEYIRNPRLTKIMVAITHLGDIAILGIILAIVLIINQKTRKLGGTVILALIGSAIVNNLILKNVVARVRPYEVIEGLKLIIPKQSDLSFPSGHAGASFAVATVIAGMTKKCYGYFAIILATLIALSRLYVGVHYPTDVLCGTVDGILIGLFLVKMDFLGVKKK